MSSRPKKTPLPPDRRSVVEGAARVVREQAEPPPDSFADGVEAHRTLKRMCPETEAGCDLGPYVPHDVPTELHGPTQTIRFPPFWRSWFAAQTPASLAAIDRLTRREIRRLVFREILAENWKRMLAVGGSVYAAYQWGVEALVWTSERLPALRALWQALKNGPPT